MFGFFAANPRDLDFGFYLVHGMRPRGLDAELDEKLNDRLHDALRPCEAALQAHGPRDAQALATRIPRCSRTASACCCSSTRAASACSAGSPRCLFDAYLDQPGGRACSAMRRCAEPDPFRRTVIFSRTISRMLLDADDSQLVLVDYQSRLMPAIDEADAVVANALRLARWRALLEVPVLGHRAEPGGPGHVPECRALCRRRWPRCISAPSSTA